MNNIVSVIIPVGENEKESSYIRTIKSLIETAKEEIEVLFLTDGWSVNNILFKKYDQVVISSSDINLGERKTVNRGAKIAKGDYIFKIDAHCKMSKDWDIKLKKSCGDKNLVVCTLDALNEETWESLKHNYTYVSINSSIEEKWWGNYHSDDKNKEVQPTMSLTGCGWFCKKDYFLNHLTYDEDLGNWGCIGPEMSAKVEKSNGEILIHKNVRCCHLFSTNSTGYPISVVAKTRKEILKRYGQYIYNLVKKFEPVPSWENIDKYCFEDIERSFMYETDVTRKDEMETIDEKGNLIKKIIKVYKPVHYKGLEDPDIPEKGREITKDAQIEKIKIMTLSDTGDWGYATLDTEKDINMWLFKNE